MYKNILIPTDGSDLSKAAARDGVRLAKSIGARVTTLHTTPKFYAGELVGHAVYDRAVEFQDQSTINAQNALSEVEQMAREAAVEVSTVHQVTDNPWEAIVTAAQKNDCDLIFMASHGRRGISALLMGSETNKVLIHTKIPVLVWR